MPTPLNQTDIAAEEVSLAGRHVRSYPKIFAVGHPGVPNLFDNEVTIEEKVDGSQFSFMFDSYNGLRMRSKGAVVHENDRHNMFGAAVESVTKRLDMLHPGWIYRAEYLRVPKHNTLAYDRVPNDNLIIYDVETSENIFLSYMEKAQEAARLSYEVVPLIFQGKIDNPGQLAQLLNRVSILGGQQIEGVVVKNYYQFGTDKKVQMGKYVREDFKELNMKAWKSDPDKRTIDIVQKLGETYRSYARWEKAVQHLKERGQLENQPRDIGKLITEVKDDILAEEERQIKDALYKWAKDKILRISVAGVAEWYKKRLTAASFNMTIEEYEAAAAKAQEAMPEPTEEVEEIEIVPAPENYQSPCTCHNYQGEHEEECLSLK